MFAAQSLIFLPPRSLNHKTVCQSAHLELELLGDLPGEVGVVGAAKVTVGGGLRELGLLELEVADDASRAKVEVLLDDLNELGLGLLRGAVSVDVDGERLHDTNGVRELDERALAQASSDEGLGNPAASVGSRAVDLRRVLAGESSATVGTPATVGVDDDLAASEAGVTVRATDDEAARGVEVVDGVVVKHGSVDNLLDHVLVEVLLDLLVGDLVIVLRGDDDGVDAERLEDAVGLLVLHSDLGLAVGADPCAGAVLAD